MKQTGPVALDIFDGVMYGKKQTGFPRVWLGMGRHGFASGGEIDVTDVTQVVTTVTSRSGHVDIRTGGHEDNGEL
jgi:hypothetical protein